MTSAAGSGGKPNRSKLALMGGLAVVLVAVVVRTFSSGPEQAVAAGSEEESAASVGSTPAPTRPVAHVPRVIDWPSKVSRDPFTSSLVYRPAVVVKPEDLEPPAPPPVVPPPAPIDLTKEANEAVPLTATVLGDRPIAMINGRIYPVGGVVGGFRIVEIHARRIVVERSGQRIAIDVKE